MPLIVIFSVTVKLLKRSSFHHAIMKRLILEFFAHKALSLSGHERVAIKTVDTDTIIIATSLFRQLHLEQLWIEFGTGKDKRWLPIHDYTDALGDNNCSDLLFWYVFSGCDTFSSFAGTCKVSALYPWKDLTQIANFFIAL